MNASINYSHNIIFESPISLNGILPKVLFIMSVIYWEDENEGGRIGYNTEIGFKETTLKEC